MEENNPKNTKVLQTSHALFFVAGIDIDDSRSIKAVDTQWASRDQ